MGFQKVGAGFERVLKTIVTQQHHHQLTQHRLAVRVFRSQLLHLVQRDLWLIAAETDHSHEVCLDILTAEFELFTAAAGARGIRVDGHRWHLVEVIRPEAKLL